MRVQDHYFLFESFMWRMSNTYVSKSIMPHRITHIKLVDFLVVSFKCKKMSKVCENGENDQCLIPHNMIYLASVVVFAALVCYPLWWSVPVLRLIQRLKVIGEGELSVFLNSFYRWTLFHWIVCTRNSNRFDIGFILIFAFFDIIPQLVACQTK